MKPWIILTVLAVALTAAITVAGTFISSESGPIGPEFPAPVRRSGPLPKLVLNEDNVFKLNDVSQETKGSHEWTIKNDGEGVLEIRGDSTSCSCTTSDLFEGSDLKTGKLVMINPGESKQVKVNYNTKKFTGNYRQFIKVATNDPDKPVIDLVFQGTVKQALVTLPADPSVSFMNVGNDEPVLRRLIVSSPDHPETKITKMVCSNPELIDVQQVALTPEEAKQHKFDSGYWINITLKPSPNLGEFNEEIVVETDHPLRKSIPLAIKVKGKIVGPVSVIPEKVQMFNATSSDGGSQDLTIWARNRSALNLTVASKPEGMDVSIVQQPSQPEIKGSHYKMTVTLAAGRDPGLVEGEILLKTDDPKASEIRVPVAVLIKGSR